MRNIVIPHVILSPFLKNVETRENFHLKFVVACRRVLNVVARPGRFGSKLCEPGLCIYNPVAWDPFFEGKDKVLVFRHGHTFRKPFELDTFYPAKQ